MTYLFNGNVYKAKASKDGWVVLETHVCRGEGPESKWTINVVRIPPEIFQKLVDSPPTICDN